MEKNMNLFIPITKVDAKRHEVWGWGAIEERDNSDEILDYATSKPNFLEWSQKAQKRSGGKSKGNVRAMHQPIAAGKLIDMQADDVRKGFFVGAKIVDENEWKKVESGVYTGFSVGGSYVKRWSDYQNPGAIRYTAKPTELSIVDAPCIPSATFEMVKADGISRLGFKPALGKNLIKVIEAPRMIKVVRGDAMEKADFEESKHPRANDGKFTSGGGGGGGGGSKASESKPAKKPEMHHPLHDTPDTVIGRDFEPHPTNSGSTSTHDAKITTHHPLHNTPDTVIGSDGKPRPAAQPSSPKAEGNGDKDNGWTFSDGKHAKVKGDKSAIIEQLPDGKFRTHAYESGQRIGMTKPLSFEEAQVAGNHHVEGLSGTRIEPRKELEDYKRKTPYTPKQAREMGYGVNDENVERQLNAMNRKSQNEKVTKGVVMDKLKKVYDLLEKAEQELADEAPAELPPEPAPAAENMEVPKDLEKLPDEEPAPESVDGETFDESELDDEAEKLEEEPAPEMAAADAGYDVSAPEEVLKVIQNTVVKLAEILIQAENALQKQDKVPGAPEPIADIPLKSEVGASFNVEQMPAPNVLLEIKPNAEPQQETLAEHAVMSKDLSAAFEAWLPKVGAMVKSTVAEEVSKAIADLSKATKSAPVRMIPVVKKDNHKEGVSA